VIGANISLSSFDFILAVIVHGTLAIGAVCCLRKALPPKPAEAPEEGGAG
jgi:hypothetical protein